MPTQPIDNRQKLINTDGTPTEYFIRILRERGVSTDSTAEELATLGARSIIAGLGLSGGGNLETGNVTLALNAILDNLNDVDLTIAPTNGQVLKYDGAAGLWKAGVGGGGGGGGGGTFRGEWGVAYAAGGTFEYSAVENPYVLPAGWVVNTGSVETVADADAPIGTTHALTFNPAGGLGDGANRTITITMNVAVAGNFVMRSKTQGEGGFDGTRIIIDGLAVYDRRTLDTTYVEYSGPLTAGVRTVIIQYVSDGSITAGYENTRISRIVLPSDAGTSPYAYGDTVTYLGRKYFCLLANTIQTPSAAATQWALFANA